MIYRWPITGLSYYLPTSRCWLSYFDPVSGRAEPRCYQPLEQPTISWSAHWEWRFKQAAERRMITYPLPTPSRTDEATNQLNCKLFHAYFQIKAVFNTQPLCASYCKFLPKSFQKSSMGRRKLKVSKSCVT